MAQNCPFCGRFTIGNNRICDDPECRKQMQDGWLDSAIEVPEGFLTVAKFAEIKGISIQAVTKNCRKGNYPGAFQDKQSERWYVPADAIGLPEGGPRSGAGRPKKEDQRKRRTFRATDEEWEKIVEAAAQTEHSTNDYIIRIVLGKNNNKKGIKK